MPRWMWAAVGGMSNPLRLENDQHTRPCLPISVITTRPLRARAPAVFPGRPESARRYVRLKAASPGTVSGTVFGDDSVPVVLLDDEPLLLLPHPAIANRAIATTAVVSLVRLSGLFCSATLVSYFFTRSISLVELLTVAVLKRYFTVVLGAGAVSPTTLDELYLSSM